MTIETSKSGNASVIKLRGRMDGETCKKFEAAWDQALAEGSIYLVADVSELVYINSAGIGTFVRNGQLALKKGGSLRVCGLRGFVLEIFHMAQLTRAFPIYETTADALQNIG